MQNIRCRCGKIVCQVENLPDLLQGEGAREPLTIPAVVILCRHCKRHVVLEIPGIMALHHNSAGEKAKAAHFFSTCM